MATITITTTSAEDTRIAAAFGTMLGLNRNATAAEIKAWVVGRLKDAVFGEEQRIAAFNAAAAVSPIAPT